MARAIGSMTAVIATVALLGFVFVAHAQGTTAPGATPSEFALVGIGVTLVYALSLAIPVSVGRRLLADAREMREELGWLRLVARDWWRQRAVGTPAPETAPDDASQERLQLTDMPHDLLRSVTLNGAAQPLRDSGEALGTEWEIGALAHVFHYGERGHRLPPGPYAAAADDAIDPGTRLAARVVGVRVPALLPSRIDQNVYLVGALLCRHYDAVCPREIELRCAQHGRSFDGLWSAADAYLSAYRYAPDDHHGIRVLHLPTLPPLERDAGGAPLPAVQAP